MSRAIPERKDKLEEAEKRTWSCDGFENIDITTPEAHLIFKWLSMIPPHPSLLLHPEVPRRLDATIYRDWLYWADSAAQPFLDELDIHEMEYRRLGLK